jgi:hypothetical protein
MNKMKKIICFLAFIVSCSYVFSQSDTLNITTTLSREITNGKPTTKNITVQQQIIDRDGIPIREVFFDEKTLQISKYIVYFAKEGKIISEEHFSSKDSLLFANKFSYNSKGFREACEVYVTNGKGLILKKKMVYIYRDTTLTQIKELTAKNKTEKQTKLSYNNQQKLTSTVSTYNKPYIQGIKEEKVLQVYDENGLIKERLSVCTKTNSISDTLHTIFIYNEGRLVEESIFTGSELSGKISYGYTPDGRLSFFSETDKNGDQLKLHSYMYQTRYMNKGANKSVFD